MLTTKPDVENLGSAPRVMEAPPPSFPPVQVVSVYSHPASRRRRARCREIGAIEDERQRLARELHDEAGYRLTVAALHLDGIAAGWGEDAELCERLKAVRLLIRECTTSFQDIAFNLHPRVLKDLGLAPAVRCLVRKTQEAGEAAISVDVLGTAERLGEDAELAAFRIVQEALTNAAKYARASHVTVRLAFLADGADIEVIDDGRGFDPVQNDDPRPRLGLKGMRERVELVGGTVSIESQPGCGTRIRARLPRMDVA